jgi:ABC-type phosphate transport system permease subunit
LKNFGVYSFFAPHVQKTRSYIVGTESHYNKPLAGRELDAQKILVGVLFLPTTRSIMLEVLLWNSKP